MNAASDARKNIKYITSLVRGLLALDEELEAVGSLEKLATQKQIAVGELERQEAAAHQRLIDLATEYDARRKDAETRVQAMTANAEAVLAEAEAKRQEGLDASLRVAEEIAALKQTAAIDAEAILATARAEAAAIAADTEAHMRADHAQTAKELDAVRERVEEAKATLAAITADIEKARQDKTDLDALIEALRLRFAPRP